MRKYIVHKRHKKYGYIPRISFDTLEEANRYINYEYTIMESESNLLHNEMVKIKQEGFLIVEYSESGIPSKF